MSLVHSDQVQQLLDRVAGLDGTAGNPRVKAIVRRVAEDMMRTIEDLDITSDEFWAGVAYVTKLGYANEAGLLVPGLGIETFLDIKLDEEERQAGIEGGTPRTIEGPLYIAGAPKEQGFARLDDGTETGEVLIMEGQVRDKDGNAIANAVVDVWHANTKGGYSFFDPSQSKYNLRRPVVTDAEGRYKFRSILPVGYACPPDGVTQALLDQLGRHGHRPAHIHFFVSAEGYRHLTTQINIDGDEYLHDDFAFATRDELIPPVEKVTDAERIRANGLNDPYTAIVFDFVLHAETADAPKTVVERAHAMAD
jgi:catechol 1,2-dioxygenase